MVDEQMSDGEGRRDPNSAAFSSNATVKTLSSSNFRNDTEKQFSRCKKLMEFATFLIACGGAIAACFAAFYTSQQVDVARDTEQRQLRAYLAFDPYAASDKGASLRFNCIYSDPKKKTFNDCVKGNKVEMRIRNFGATPALQPEICTLFQHAQSDIDFDFKGRFALAIKQCGEFLQATRAISPTETVVNGIVLQDGALQALQRTAKGDGIAFVISTIAYVDVFGRRHRAHSCVAIKGDIQENGAVDCGGKSPEDY